MTMFKLNFFLNCLAISSFLILSTKENY